MKNVKSILCHGRIELTKFFRKISENKYWSSNNKHPVSNKYFNPISSGISEQREAPGGGLGDPHYLIPVKQKIEISALVQWHIYSKWAYVQKDKW